MRVDVQSRGIADAPDWLLKRDPIDVLLYPSQVGAEPDGQRTVKEPPNTNMHARLVQFGKLDINGKHFGKDVVIEDGKIRKRNKNPSKLYRDRYGHTPLSADETIPWHGQRLIIGTGTYGKLPIMAEVSEEAQRRGIEIVALPTAQACQLIDECPDAEVNAILHVTC